MVRFFWDSYAVAEFIAGNPKFARFSDEPVVLTIFNLAEVYWIALREYGEKIAEEIFEGYWVCVVDVDDETLREAVKFRKKVYGKKKISYADAVGYVYALRNGLLFLTGDKEFEGLSGVEFVRK